MVGKTMFAFCLDKQPLLTRCSLFQRNKARSTTWKWLEFRQRERLSKRMGAMVTSWSAPSSSKISSSSLRKRTCFEEQLQGQHLKKPVRMWIAVSGSFSTYCMMQYESCWWYIPTHLGLWRGMRALTRNWRCSFLSGMAKPLMMLPKISNSSPIPLCRSVSYSKR